MKTIYWVALATVAFNAPFVLMIIAEAMKSKKPKDV